MKRIGFKNVRATVLAVAVVAMVISVSRAFAAGNYEVQWNKNFGGSDGEYFWSVATTVDGGYVAVGESWSTDQDLASLNKGAVDAIITKYDEDPPVLLLHFAPGVPPAAAAAGAEDAGAGGLPA